MKPPNHPGEINFYEELGVSHDATAEEIRDAFRSLVRLLHPDQQTDPQLKETAERQMRKLNPIYFVLSDPERRRRYDEDLDDGYPQPILLSNGPPRDYHRILGRLVWVVAILLSGGILFWLASDNTPATNAGSRTRVSDSPLDTPLSSKLPDNPADAAAEIRQLQSDLNSTSVQRDAAVRELNALRGTAAATATPNPDPQRFPATQNRVDRSPPTVAMTELPSPPRLSPTPASPYGDALPANPLKVDPARTDPAPANRRLVGFWFYVKPARGQKNKNHTLYPPEYIEAIITEENGVLHGKYRSRFDIVDRAISPDVNFSFSGTPNGASITCPWTGPGGAKGELTLRLVSENSIRVDWKAIELGSRQGLTSGTAVLTRKLE
jgi:curved DNA-binding protein CbpA